MTHSPVQFEELERAPEELIVSIVGAMPDVHRQFLLSLTSPALIRSFSTFAEQSYYPLFSGCSATSTDSLRRIARSSSAISKPFCHRRACRAGPARKDHELAAAKPPRRYRKSDLGKNGSSSTRFSKMICCSFAVRGTPSSRSRRNT